MSLIQSEADTGEPVVVQPYESLVVDEMIRKEMKSYWSRDFVESDTNPVEDLILKLVSEKDRFVHIYRTENGSIYFQTNDGTVKVKKENGFFYNEMVPSLKSFFIDEVEFERLYDLTLVLPNAELICNKDIKISTTPVVGMRPFRFGNPNFPPVQYSLKDNVIVINADPPDFLNGQGVHFGNKIVEIIK